jgi:hypothetical protein
VFSGGDRSYTLEFGSVEINTHVSASLDILNALQNGATAQFTDALDGSFSGGGPFGLIGFSPFAGILGGAEYAPMFVNFDPTLAGLYREVVIFYPVSDNSAGLGRTALGPISLTIEATAVPEPATLTLLGSGIIGLWMSRRRREAR